MCGQKKINKRIHKTLEINYNFPSKVYEKSKLFLFTTTKFASKFAITLNKFLAIF